MDDAGSLTCAPQRGECGAKSGLVIEVNSAAEGLARLRAFRDLRKHVLGG